MRILIIEDEFKIADVIASRLKKEQFVVDVFTDGEEGLDNALTNIYDLIILDVMLPKVNGFEILEEIRKEKVESKVIMLTAKSMLEDKLVGFNYGANDYLTKPFHIDELVARVNAQLRTNNAQIANAYLEAGDLKLNIKTAFLLCKTTNESIEVMCKEFLLLEFLIKNVNQVLSKEQIYDKVCIIRKIILQYK
ncbi:MAG TPA: DNA-binding response regulator [Firmicutes bacterium]|nr:DNA-binding response regulator [Bacillota bacterium]